MTDGGRQHATHGLLGADRSVLYEITSLTFQESEDVVARAAMDKATR